MLRIVCVLMLLTGSICVQAQKKELKGTVADSSSKEPLEMATVTVQNSKDSSLITYTLTDNKGAFRLTDVPAETSIRLLISYTGYRTYSKILGIERNADQGTIHLAPAVTELNAVVIQGDVPPVTIRKDTIEFNAASFKTKQYSVVEDLLKKLPGVDVDQEGNITVNGKKVSRVLVDGREFFTGNLQMATKNLPVDIVDKVQVVDTKTKAEARMGIPKDGEDKTINLTLKADKKRGIFGKLSAGGGTDERYELGGMFNGFDGDRQFTLMGSSNNLNKMGFSPMEMMSSGPRGGGGGGGTMMGAAAAMMGGMGMDGIRTSTMLAYNYNDKFNKTDMNSSYTYTGGNTRTRTLSNREYLNADSHLFSGSERDGYNRNNGHRVNFTFNVDLDSSWMLNIVPSISYNRNNSNNSGLETTKGADGSLVNRNETLNRSTGSNFDFGNNITLTKIMKKPGRNLSLILSHQNGSSNSDAYNINNVDYYTNDVITDTRRLDQLTVSDNTQANYRASITYTEPFSESLRMEIGYGFNYSSNTSNRQTYNYNAADKGYTDLDDTYTNKFRTLNTSQTPNVALTYNNKKIQANVGATMYLNVLDNYTYTTNTTLRQNQNNFSPNARITYNLKNFSNLSLNYNGMMMQPTLDQLQPVPDNTNTLNQRIGNPDLKPSFSQNVSLSYMKFNPKFVFMSSFGFMPVMNRFSTASFVNSKGERTTQTINVDGTYSYMGNINITKMLKNKNNQYRITAGGFFMGNKTISFSNTGNAAGDTTLYRNIVNNTNYAPILMFNYSYKEFFEMALSYRPNFTDARYKPTSIAGGSYFMHMASLGTSVYFLKKFTWDNDFNYTYNSRITPGFKKDVKLWNASVAYDYKMLQFKFSAFDLLHENTSVRRMATDLYIEDVQSNIVDQYFMVTLMWNFSKFGAKPFMGAPKRRMEGRGMMMPSTF